MFGGWDASKHGVRSCEKWTDSGRPSLMIGNMTYPRAYFAPAHYRGLIYLVSTKGKDLRSIETFNPDSEIFSVLAVSLPNELILGGASIAFVYNRELCVLTERKQLVRWNLNTNECRMYETDRQCWSNQQPLIVGKEVFIAWAGKLLQFSMESYSFVEPKLAS